MSFRLITVLNLEYPSSSRYSATTPRDFNISSAKMNEKDIKGTRSVSMSSEKDVKLFSDGIDTVTSTGETKRMSASVAIDPAAEKRLVWKFDLRILPTLAVMYLFNSLDKSNLGNAKTAGLEDDLGLKGDDYNLILSIFFIPYVLTAPFLGIAGKKFGPSRVLPLMMFSFGFFTLMVVAVQNFGGLLALRWFLGMSESAFFPLVIYCECLDPGESRLREPSAATRASVTGLLKVKESLSLSSSGWSVLSFTDFVDNRSNHILSTRGTRKAAGNFLRRLLDCFRFWWATKLWSLSDTFWEPRELAVSVYHRGRVSIAAVFQLAVRRLTSAFLQDVRCSLHVLRSGICHITRSPPSF